MVNLRAQSPMDKLSEPGCVGGLLIARQSESLHKAPVGE